MYLHLGQDTVVRLDQVIGIFDLDTATISKVTRDYLARAEKAGEVENITYELPKSFIVCRDDKSPTKQRVYISQISSTTLLKRSVYINDIRI